jgi:hypothetical protein
VSPRGSTTTDHTLVGFVNSVTLSLPCFDERVDAVASGESVLSVLARTDFAKQTGYIIEDVDCRVEQPDAIHSVRDIFALIQKKNLVVIVMGKSGCIVKPLHAFAPKPFPPY